jgi:SAM-dependent methyltransferase
MTEWFKKWFSSDEYLSVYSHRNEKDALSIINLILNQFPNKDRLNILDAACGAGRHSILLSELGHNLTAFDLSKTLLRIGFTNSKELNVNINFICSDIREIKLNSSFDLVLNMFTSFGYFDSDYENFLFYQNIRDSLKDDGLIVFDYFNSVFIEENLIPSSTKTVDGKFITEHRRIENKKVIKEISINNDGKISNFCESVKLYNKSELFTKFSSLGYQIENIYGSYDGKPFDEKTSERVILFIKK